VRHKDRSAVSRAAESRSGQIAISAQTMNSRCTCHQFSSVMAHFTWAIQGSPAPALVALDGPGKPGHDSFI
jgi:hypothetical protein